MSHVFITGFMGAGKSTVGRLVAERLGRPFVDLDSQIESREGSSVREIFRERGESGFRDAEHAALEALVQSEPAVVATGGGVVLRDDNQVLLKRHGTVIYLAVTPEEAMARLGDGGDRPLLAGGGLAAAQSILGARLTLYAATADRVVDTGGRDAREVADAVVAALVVHTGDVIRVGMEADEAGYEVVVARGALESAGAMVREVSKARRAVVVSDTTVWGLLGQRAEATLRDAGFAVSAHLVPAGESSKSWQMAGTLLEEFAAASVDRGSVVVGLGGGVVGDLAGFCAATYMRGIALVHLPTTLLAQVDSAIGGKTAVDLAAGKNLAGAFWPPRLVVADTDVLGSLPAAEWTNGLVEVVKAALLRGGDTLERFERDLPAIMAREEVAVRGMVRDAVAFKAEVVTDDLREADRRECLNLGHTLGHALEVLAGYGALPHGLAVAEGMRFAGRLAQTLAGAEPGLAERTEALLGAVGAGRAVCAERLKPILGGARPDAILQAMKADKKARNGVVRFVLLEAPGAWRAEGVDESVLLSELDEWAERVSREGA